MEQLFVPQSPPENATPEEFNAYLNRMFRDIAQNFEAIADGRTIEKRHVAPSKPRDGMVVYADGTNWNPGSGEGFYQRVNGVWVFNNDLQTLFDANTILKADSDNTPVALTVAEQTLVGRITAGSINDLSATQVRTLLNVEDGSTADQTNAEIKTAYEANSNTNAFTDAEQTKLSGIETGAQVNVNLGTEQATTSGTTKDFTGIPAGVSIITINFEDVSNDGATTTTDFLIQLGDAGGIETTGYTETVALIRDNASPRTTAESTSGFTVDHDTAGTHSVNGTMTLERKNDNVWCATSVITTKDGDHLSIQSGIKELSAELTQLRLSIKTADSFDAGSVNIAYQ
jgi:hypothetical protein